MAVGLVGGTGLICDVVFVDPFVCVFGVSSVTAVVHVVARNEYLGSEVDVWPLSFSKDFDSVAEG